MINDHNAYTEGFMMVIYRLTFGSSDWGLPAMVAYKMVTPIKYPDSRDIRYQHL